MGMDGGPGGHEPKRDERAVYIIIGVLLVVAGLWLLGGTPFLGWSMPWLEPLRASMRLLRQVAWPLVVIGAGVLIIVYSQRPGARLPSRGARLTRSRDARVVAGVLGGLAEYFGIDPAILRVAVVLVALVLGIVGQLLIAYIVAAVVVPNAKPQAAGDPPPPSTS